MIEGPDGWWLAPECAAVRPAERTAVVADVHLGYEWARGAGGDCLPGHSLAEAVARFEALLGRVELDRLVVAGDLVESSGFCRKTAADLARLETWLATRGVALVRVRGNHDPRVLALPATLEVAGWTIVHGDRPLPAGHRTISGHHHPILRVEAVSAPCFVVAPDAIVLPAFSRNAAGLNVLGPGTPRVWRAPGVRCIAGLDDTMLDFGPIAALRRRVGAPA